MCLNDWSVPHTLVRKTLTVAAGPNQVRVLDGQTVVATHVRCYDRGQQIEDASHIAKLVERKTQAHEQRGMSRLTQAAPASKELLERAAERGERLGGITTALLRLIDRYGAAEVQAAILVALERGVPHPNAVRLALETQREALHQPPPVAALMPAHVAARDTTVRPHRLESYDQLTNTLGGHDES